MDYFEDLYNIDIQEQIAVHICGFDGVQSAVITTFDHFLYGKNTSIIYT